MRLLSLHLLDVLTAIQKKTVLSQWIRMAPVAEVQPGLLVVLEREELCSPTQSEYLGNRTREWYLDSKVN